MEEKKVFCEHCRNDVSFSTNDVQMTGTIKGENYKYMGKEAHCLDCGAEVYVEEVNDYNLKSLYDVYREQSGLISLNEILAIPDKYGIGKRPLSILLGWGEQTFSRYCAGDMPTKQYSEVLQRIYNDPQYYANLLETNKDNLKSTSTYEKSKKAVDLLLDVKSIEESKIDLAIGYLLNQCEDITPLALQKALYYIQGFYCAFYNSFLFNEDCEAWVHGPVYRDIYFRYKSYRFDEIDEVPEFNSSIFSSGEKSILDSVIKNLCCYSGKVLESFTHAETPWLATRGDLPSESVSNKVIPKDLISKYFIAVKEKYSMLNPNDIKDYAQKMFEEL